MWIGGVVCKEVKENNSKPLYKRGFRHLAEKKKMKR